MFYPTLLILAVSLALPAVGSAVALVVTNPSFETPNIANGTFSGNSTTGPSGWGWSRHAATRQISNKRS